MDVNMETFNITEYNQKECENIIRKMLENYNDLENNAKENLVLFCLIGIAEIHKSKNNLPEQEKKI